MVENSKLDKYLYKIELYLIKVIPFILACVAFLNTVLSYFNIDIPLLSYIGGMSLIPLLFLYISSFVFKFCLFHRLSLYYITLNWTLNIVDFYIIIPINDRYMMSMYLIITFIFIVLAIYGHCKEKFCKDFKRNY